MSTHMQDLNFIQFSSDLPNWMVAHIAGCHVDKPARIRYRRDSGEVFDVIGFHKHPHDTSRGLWNGSVKEVADLIGICWSWGTTELIALAESIRETFRGCESLAVYVPPPVPGR